MRTAVRRQVGSVVYACQRSGFWIPRSSRHREKRRKSNCSATAQKLHVARWPVKSLIGFVEKSGPCTKNICHESARQRSCPAPTSNRYGAHNSKHSPPGVTCRYGRVVAWPSADSLIDIFRLKRQQTTPLTFSRSGAFVLRHRSVKPNRSLARNARTGRYA